MHFGFAIGPLIALIAGILILIIPRLLNYIVSDRRSHIPADLLS